MKPLKVILITAAAAVAFFAPVESKADSRHGRGHSHHHHCEACEAGSTVRKVCVGHTHSGRPIYRYITVAHTCQTYSSHHGHGHGYSKPKHNSHSHSKNLPARIHSKAKSLLNGRHHH